MAVMGDLVQVGDVVRRRGQTSRKQRVLHLGEQQINDISTLATLKWLISPVNEEPTNLVCDVRLFYRLPLQDGTGYPVEERIEIQSID